MAAGILPEALRMSTSAPLPLSPSSSRVVRTRLAGVAAGRLASPNTQGTTNYSIALSTNSQGSIIQMDGTVTANGSFQRQNTGAFSNPAIAGGYVFDFNGVEV